MVKALATTTNLNSYDPTLCAFCFLKMSNHEVRPGSPMSTDEAEPASPDNIDLSLSGYLNQCHLPWFLSQATNLRSPYTPDNIWPRYVTLERPSGTRLLQSIFFVGSLQFATSVLRCKSTNSNTIHRLTLFE